jgi:hypothetical protein
MEGWSSEGANNDMNKSHSRKLVQFETDGIVRANTRVGFCLAWHHSLYVVDLNLI